MASEAELIVRTLDKHLTAAADIRLFGGAALVLGYGRSRATEDVDVLLDDAECQVLIESAGLSGAVAAAVVPDVLREAFDASRPRLERLLASLGG